jgi:uncharacterized protein
MTDEHNSLAEASSAYLRSAMHQPIRWHEWGEEAFALARRENKPVLLDIGAVWCHWCHVMDRESYENPDVAQIVNEHYVAVKVDRDERPDVDSRYQAAVQAISGQGGWPLTAFLTPDGHPFFGGTYFPPDERMGRPGFKRVLLAIAQAFREKSKDVAESAESVMGFISQAETFSAGAGQINPQLPQRIVQSAKSMFDAEHGGFGTAPKFPHPSVVDLLIDHYVRTGDGDTRNIVVTTLERMAKGGVYDQLGGGFHRYSVDERWVVPHFEKMSYDNSELLKNYVHAYQATGIEFFAEVARDIIRWMDHVLSDREHGGFCASQDADVSLDDDGDYFTWTVKEAREVLTDDELMAASLYYDIGETGEMQHNHLKNVLFVSLPVDEIAKRMKIGVERVNELLRSAKKKMFDARAKRPMPFVDTTVYAGWNALCVSAYLDAARVLGLDNARHFALKSLDRVLSQGLSDAGKLAHVIAYSGPAPRKPQLAGVLDDYAFTALACLDAWETTSDMTYFNFARRLVDSMIEHFYDQENGGFFDTADISQLGALTARRKPLQDTPTPAGNSAAAIALLRLWSYANDESYHERARRTLEAFAAMADQYGIFAATYGIATVLYTKPHTQVIVIGNDDAAKMLYNEAVAVFSLTKSALCLSDSEATPQYLPPALRETIPALAGGNGKAVLCSNFACQPPISDPQELRRALREAVAHQREDAAAD